jgi:hypothetical protein
MYFEWTMSLSCAAQMGESAFKTQSEVFAEQAKRYLFDPDLAEYSVGVHIVANLLHLNDPILAFTLASALASVSLNLVDEMFDSLRIPEQFARWGDRNRNLLVRRDRGFAFLILAHFAPEVTHKTDVLKWLNDTVQNAGLGSLAEIASEALDFKLQIRPSHFEGDMGQELYDLLTRGDLIAKRCGIFPTSLKAQQALDETGLPPIVLSDLAVFDTRSKLDNEEAEDFFKRLRKRTSLVWDLSDFIDACGL